MRIFKMVYIASFVVLALLLLVAISFWNFSEFFENRRMQFVFFLTEMVLLIIPITFLVLLAGQFTREKPVW